MYCSSNSSFEKEKNTKMMMMGSMKCYSEICHFGHKQHKLRYEYCEFPFKCDGCKEVGIGSRYKCSICEYDLHMQCALPSPTTLFHPFYPKCAFQFLSHPPGDIPRYCNACENAVRGFLYHCVSCGFDLHPCCAKLPMLLDHEVKLYLYKKVSSACHRCGQKGRSWSYRSKCKKYNLHVACVRDMLLESWHENDGIPFPGLKNTLQAAAHHNASNKGKVRKCCEIAGFALQIVVSALLGDPTALIAGIAGSLMSRA